MRDVRESIPTIMAPSGPKVREWGKPQQHQSPASGNGMPGKGQPALGKSSQGYSKPVGFVKAEDPGSKMAVDDRGLAGKGGKTDEELESDRKEGRRRDEEVSFRDVSICVCF